MIVCDTGPLVAVLNENDADHQRCLDLLERHAGPLVVPSPVLAEVCYFLETRVGPTAEARFLDSIADGEIELVELTRVDLARMAELVRRYADFPLGAVDAAVLAVTERLDVYEVATLDRRHFSAVRTRHLKPLRLLPD
ncbi:type II toxin-antitoxin system VapC family toxin [Nocardia cyriacigeorgica]|uniref:type II toxin-antitoxin system VapC family toxin n=1 Tax=Nocardia cyriacigeorgica TaxID=135487 RepID=UPI001894A3FA|nr:PIN domain-containing protein [Nocardia cyriacigeorgica]MBF6086986.1 PIN domain-containing protein [Nocardia cyriacigeorgica]MBF6093077.1 PIN domain-containing protein [Nocardia cyriacigeorgica]